MAIIIALVAGLIVSGFVGLLLHRSEMHKQTRRPYLSNILNGVIGAFIFFCVSLFVYTFLV